MPDSSWNRPFSNDSGERNWCITRIEDSNTCRSNTLSDCLFKAEVIHCRGPWRSFNVVEHATLEWVNWFNHRRFLDPIGNTPPAKAEATSYTAMETSEMAA